MATLSELFALGNNFPILDKLTAAVAIQAETIRTEAAGTANHANRLIWAKQAYSDPRSKAQSMIWAILAANASATTAQITAATDASIQSAVAAAVDTFATGA
jgi:hypothetical protein